MALASVLRLEFSYPGVGILAGDSIQYLAIVTAHGVIMVFFMITPAIFGAFGNFLLPTHLGVHDVAFPRLNSAAFWFLPGGLIMLCQLVCVDRRYQRMNCFNIRELQGILKRKFFVDLLNSGDHHNLLETTTLGLRFKNHQHNLVQPNQNLFYIFGIENLPKTKQRDYKPVFFGTKLPAYTYGDQQTQIPYLYLGFFYKNQTILVEILNLIKPLFIFATIPNLYQQFSLQTLYVSFLQNLNYTTNTFGLGWAITGSTNTFTTTKKNFIFKTEKSNTVTPKP